jgi:hypothetical protein
MTWDHSIHCNFLTRSYIDLRIFCQFEQQDSRQFQGLCGLWLQDREWYYSLYSIHITHIFYGDGWLTSMIHFLCLNWITHVLWWIDNGTHPCCEHDSWLLRELKQRPQKPLLPRSPTRLVGFHFFQICLQTPPRNYSRGNSATKLYLSSMETKKLFFHIIHSTMPKPLHFSLHFHNLKTQVPPKIPDELHSICGTLQGLHLVVKSNIKLAISKLRASVIALAHQCIDFRHNPETE